MKFKKFLAVMVALLTALLPLFSVPAGAANNQGDIATEYYTDDLFAAPVFSTDTAIPTATTGTTLDIKAKSVVLMEPYTGKILYQNNPDEKLAPASITKIMSLLLIMEAIENGKLTLDTVVTASEHACSMGGSQIWLEPGETMTVDELLRATVIASANDTTVALAETVAGSEEGFVAMMNARAKELGMTNTHFVNACGLDADGHLTTAHDVAIMSSALIKHDLIKKYSTVWMDTLRNGKSELVNTNKLVRYYPGCTGLKTGTTGTAGYCLSATAKRDGMELVAVVMGGATSNDRFAGAKKLLDYGFANWTFMTISADMSKVLPIAVKGGLEKSIKAKPDGVKQILLPKGSDKKITQQAEVPKELVAPVTEGDNIGKVHLMMDGNEIGQIPLLADQSVAKMTFFSALGILLGSLFTP